MREQVSTFGLNRSARRDQTPAERAKVKARHLANQNALANWNRAMANDPSGKGIPHPERMGGYKRGGA